MIKQKLPRHIAIIMDGNGRWATAKNLPRIMGHREGVKSVKTIVETCSKQGIEVLTLWAFSTENWRRPKSEVQFLLNLMVITLNKEVKNLHKNQVQLHVIGDLSQLNPKLQTKIQAAIDLTANNSGLKLTIAFNYGGHWDITQAMQKLATKVVDHELSPAEITPALISENLSTHSLPDPDLLIRTGGELRISNFMMWQLAYTELYFTEILWPDFRELELEQALIDFAKRDRRFGNISPANSEI